jgi:hypothetical protein
MSGKKSEYAAMQNTIMQQRNKADELHAKNENVAM